MHNNDSFDDRGIPIEDAGVEIENFGNEFLLLRAAKNQDVPLTKIGRALFERQFDFVDDVIVTEVEICLRLNRNFDDSSFAQVQHFAPRLSSSSAAAAAIPSDQTVYRLPVWFDEQADWDLVCRSTGLDRDEYKMRLSECRFRVAMLGFLPGFVYLSGLPKAMRVARKSNPDRRTPARSFAIGGNYAGIYSLPSPGGWNVLGKVAIGVLSTDRLPPVDLHPEDQCIIEAIDLLEYQRLRRSKPTLAQFNG